MAANDNDLVSHARFPGEATTFDGLVAAANNAPRPSGHSGLFRRAISDRYRILTTYHL